MLKDKNKGIVEGNNNQVQIEIEDNSNNNRLESMNNSNEDVKIMINTPTYDNIIDQEEFMENSQYKRQGEKCCPECFIF